MRLLIVAGIAALAAVCFVPAHAQRPSNEETNRIAQGEKPKEEVLRNPGRFKRVQMLGLNDVLVFDVRTGPRILGTASLSLPEPAITGTGLAPLQIPQLTPVLPANTAAMGRLYFPSGPRLTKRYSDGGRQDALGTRGRRSGGVKAVPAPAH